MSALSIELQLLSRTIALRAAHLTAQDAARNARAKGGKSFWREIAETVQVHEEAGRVLVGATHVAASIKHTGGRVSAPGRGEGSLHRKALTIPVGIARQKRWDTDKAEDAGYHLFRGKGKQSDILFGTHGKGKRAETEALFVLRKSANVPASPWWPDDADVNANIARALDETEWNPST